MEFNPPWRLARIRPCPYLRSTLATICRLGPNVSFRVGDGVPPGLGCCTQPCKTGAACLPSRSLLRAQAHKCFMFALSWMHFRISEKLQQGYGGLFYTRDFQHFRALVGIFLHNCLLTWDFNIRHTEYLLWTLGIVELHRKTGQEFSTPRAVFSPWSVMELLEKVVFPLYTLSNFPLIAYMCIELTNIHILMYVHKYMYVYIIYTHIYNYSEPFEKKNIMLLPYNTLQNISYM